MWAIQSVANSLKMQEQNEEEPMDLLGSPNESGLEDMEVAGSKMSTRVVRPFDSSTDQGSPGLGGECTSQS